MCPPEFSRHPPVAILLLLEIEGLGFTVSATLVVPGSYQDDTGPCNGDMGICSQYNGDYVISGHLQSVLFQLLISASFVKSSMNQIL